MLVLAVLYAAAAAVLLTFGLNQLWLSVRHLRAGGLRRTALPPPPDVWPRVTVQLPIYNEPLVVERLIDACARLDYPAGRLEIQVLDDSTDATRVRAAEHVASWRARGVDAVRLTRPTREGFKAGALAYGLERAKGELVAVFDADFVPGPDFLRRTVPLLTNDPRLGLVQVRWGHLNGTASLLTRVQAALLDAHFVVEQDVRGGDGCFVSFNGTAGLWRRACIDDAGGWQADTLTEDLDLSYRAQLRGWRFRFLADAAVPSEVPLTAAAWRQQQFRWTKGTAETARKLLGAFRRAPLPLRTRIQGHLHLGGFLVYPAILVAALLHAPLLGARALGLAPGPAYFAALNVGLLGCVGVLLAHAVTQRALYADGLRRLLVLPALLAATMGLSLSNTRAVAEALVGYRTPFVRTPKAGALGRRAAYALRAPRLMPLLEGAMALYSLAGLLVLIEVEAWAGLGFQAMFGVGFGWLALHDVAGRRRLHRERPKRRTLALARPESALLAEAA